jgi:hypothetical protein
MKKVDHFLKTNSPRMGQGKRLKEVKSNITDNESGKMTTGDGVRSCVLPLPCPFVVIVSACIILA